MLSATLADCTPGVLVHEAMQQAGGRGGKAGQPGTDDVDRARHQMSA